MRENLGKSKGKKTKKKKKVLGAGKILRKFP